jgi:2'-5' RNA ligase
MQYLILIDVPREVREKVYKFRTEFDVLETKLEPHITILRPFEIDEKKEKNLIKEIQTIKLKYFPLGIKGFDSFEMDSNVLFLKVIVNEDLRRLYSKLKKAVEKHAKTIFGVAGKGNFDSVDDFIPHVTIAKKITDAKLKNIKKKLEGIKFESESTATSFLLYKKKKSGHWEEVHRVDLINPEKNK